jgi:DNA-binding response OmpR family regulator
MTKEKILVVDDDTELTNQIALVLNESGKYEASPVYKADVAIEELKKNKKLFGGNKIKLILLDIRMPGMTGLEFLKKLREEIDSEIGVIMITAFETMDYWVDSLFIYDATDYIKKPFTNKELLQKIDNYFAGKGNREQMGNAARQHFWQTGSTKSSTE